MSEKIEAWLNERKKGIGGSDAAAICGVSPYRTPLQVWEDKRGLSGPVPDNDAMLWGRILEAPIRQRYSDVTGRAVKIPETILRHPDLDWMIANIDGVTEEPRGVEIKTTSSPKEWGEPGTDEIPLPYIFQVQHYMMVTGIVVFDVPVLIGGRDFRIYEVQADKELQEMILKQEAEFWRMVQDNIPPEPRNYEDVIRKFRKSEAKSITASIQVLGRLVDLKGIREELALLEAKEEEAKTDILGFMKEADTLTDVDGSILATWRSAKPTKRVDLKALQAEQPDIYMKYLKEGDSIRKFLLKEVKTK